MAVPEGAAFGHPFAIGESSMRYNSSAILILFCLVIGSGGWGCATSSFFLPPGVSRDDRDRFVIQPVDAPFRFKIDLPNLEMMEARVKDGGRGMYLLLHNPDLPSLSFWVEPPGTCSSLEACKAKVARTLKKASKLKSYQKTPYEIFEYVVKLEKADMEFQHVRAEIFQDGYWIDFHVSAPGDSPTPLLKILNAIKFDRVANP